MSEIIEVEEPKLKTSQVWSFRLNDEESMKLLLKIKDSGYNKSQFFRDIALKNKTTVVRKEDSIKIIYHHNKMGNNINQVAHGINKALLSGRISEELFVKFLGELNLIKTQQRNIIDLLLYAKNNGE